MNGEKELEKLLKSIKPEINLGEFVFSTVENLEGININELEMTFKEKEGITLIVKKEIADKLNLKYSFIATWITLTVHSSLEAVGLTSAFSKVLTEEDISCNVVAGYYHDHIFIDKKDTKKAINALNRLSE